ncbi:ABC transporter ATP-binding protein [Polynucleobacter sp. AM-26B4]|nr:ABC transporter ATP-binding protein [Polynucleobacter sp. AM-26B4]
MVVSSFAEMLSIGAVLPFLGVLASPNFVYDHSLAEPFIRLFNISSSDQLLLPITILFIIAVLMASGIRMFLLWATTRLSFAMGADLSLEIYRRTLYQPYAVHLSRNSSEIIDGISIKINNTIYNVILPSITLVSSALLISSILVVLYLMSPMIALVTLGGFGSIYAVIIILTKRKILRHGQRVASESSRLIQNLQEGLGGIRDVLLDSSQEVYIQTYQATDQELRRSQASNLFISQSPRFGMEALGMVLIALLAYWMSNQPSGVSAAIPLLGAFALGAQRMLPILQQAFYGWTNIRAMQPTLKLVLGLLDQTLSNNLGCEGQQILFEKSIRFNNVSFKYDSTDNPVLSRFNLEIPKGSRIGFIGETGSGKSTLLDILMGLLNPVSGSLDVDGVEISEKNKIAWQKHIAHVPQTIFLSDRSIAENIAFGVDIAEIDLLKVKKVTKQAQISDVIESLPNQYDTKVGERGVRLSGGQRQRIGIARALYKEADVIILDEATSALDSHTEEALMRAIVSLDKNITVFMIAHRITTLKDCDMIVELGSGGVLKIVSFEDLI